MAVDQVAIDRLRLDEAFTKKMLHRAFDECWTVKCDELLLVVDDDESKVSRFGTDNEDVEKGLTQSAIQDYQMAFATETGVYLNFDSKTLWEKPEK